MGFTVSKGRTIYYKPQEALDFFFFWLPHGGRERRVQYLANSLTSRLQEVMEFNGNPQAISQQHK